MKNSNDTIGNQTRDLPTCAAVPQPTALPCASKRENVAVLIITHVWKTLVLDSASWRRKNSVGGIA